MCQYIYNILIYSLLKYCSYTWRRKEVVVSLTWVHWDLVDHRGILQAFSPQLNASYFLCTWVWNSPSRRTGLLSRIWWQWRSANRLVRYKRWSVRHGCDPLIANLFWKGGDGLNLKTTRKCELLNTLGRQRFHSFWLPNEDRQSTWRRSCQDLHLWPIWRELEQSS